MRKELNAMELDEVTGGSVTLSNSLGMVRFTTLRKNCKLNPSVNFNEVRNYLLDLYDAHADEMSEADFDRLVMNEFHARGYI